MNTRTLVVACLLAAWIYAASAAFAISPEDIVKNSNSAEQTVSYRGTKVVTMYAGKRIEARMKVVHQKPDKTRIEYIAPKELTGIVTIEKGNDSWRFLPQKKRWEHAKWDLGEETLALALKNYKVVGAGTGTVAGRPVNVVKILPKSSKIPSQTLWIDKSNYLVLKSEIRAPDGSLRSVSAFTSIDFSPGVISSKLFEVQGNVQDRPKTEPLGFTPVKPDYLPRGYVLVGVSPVKTDGGISAHLQYSNGINTISIFQKKLPKSANGKLHVEKRPNGLTIVTSTKGRFSFTVIGDIDSGELVKITKSLG